MTTCIWSYFHVLDLNFCSFLRFVYSPGQLTARSLWRVEPWYVVHMLAYALELNTTICRIVYSHLAWRTKDFKNWFQDHGLTWAVRGAHIRKGFEGKMGMYMGIGLWSLSSMNSRLRFHACMEPSDN